MTIAALFVAPDGYYPSMHDVDCWDSERDARKYTGPHAVVAHPPCQLWVNFAALNYKRWGGEHNRPGNDGGCFAHALKTVRVYGGVLEHPAGSNAWPAFGLTAPDIVLVPGTKRRVAAPYWTHMGDGPGWRTHWVCEVWQSAYGHKARKRTWLYYVGAAKPAEALWERNPGTHQIGWFDRVKPTLSKTARGLWASSRPRACGAAVRGSWPARAKPTALPSITSSLASTAAPMRPATY